jgi:hypothetical protein
MRVKLDSLFSYCRIGFFRVIPGRCLREDGGLALITALPGSRIVMQPGTDAGGGIPSVWIQHTAGCEECADEGFGEGDRLLAGLGSAGMKERAELGDQPKMQSHQRILDLKKPIPPVSHTIIIIKSKKIVPDYENPH